MTKHTPGPWRWVNSRTMGRFYLTGSGNIPIVTTKEPGITPNMSLIAASPDLLAACQTALSLIKNYWVEEHGNPVVGLVWGELERAIAKAEGDK